MQRFSFGSTVNRILEVVITYLSCRMICINDLDQHVTADADSVSPGNDVKRMDTSVTTIGRGKRNSIPDRKRLNKKPVSN